MNGIFCLNSRSSHKSHKCEENTIMGKSIFSRNNKAYTVVRLPPQNLSIGNHEKITRQKRDSTKKTKKEKLARD